MRAVVLTLGIGLAPPALAEEVRPWSGDIAATYGRSPGQELNVGGLVGEIKKNIGSRFAIGLRAGGLLGANLSDGSASGYAATPVLVKTEAFPTRARHRPYLGLGLGATFLSAGGVALDGSGLGTRADAYGARGPLFTVMPDLGVDLAGFRIGVQHSFVMGTPQHVSASLGLPGVRAHRPDTPALGTTTLQLGGHFGGPQKN